MHCVQRSRYGPHGRGGNETLPKVQTQEDGVMDQYEISAILSHPVGETTDLDSFQAAADSEDKPKIRWNSGDIIGTVTNVSDLTDERYTLKIDFTGDIASIVTENGRFPEHLQMRGFFRTGAEEGLAVLAGIKVVTPPA